MTTAAQNQVAVIPAHLRYVRKVVVLGSGVMGTGIAAHLANVGKEVLMLDIAKTDAPNRNIMADNALKSALKLKPAPFYKNEFAGRITTGNFEDDMSKIKDADWIIEVVVERLDIKKALFEKIETYRKTGTLITSNTSGIPIHMMLDGRSEDFKKHFCGTHFFNPPRYMQLLEIIPTQHTAKEVVDFFMHFGQKVLGKQTVHCKDTPAFIANRVGVYAMAKIFHLATELQLPISVVDNLTGKAIGRPSTGTFRLADLVGLDVAGNVLKGLAANCPKDEQKDTFVIPSFLDKLLDNGHLGNKTGQGFYKKTKEKDENGRTIILSFDLESQEYVTPKKVKLASLDAAKQIENTTKRIQALFKAEDAGGQLIRRSFLGLFAYVSNRIPEIADHLFAIDDALRAGFAWNFGPFEYWDLMGVEKGIQMAREQGEQIAPWVQEMLDAGHTSFYKIENNKKLFYDSVSKSYMLVPGQETNIVLSNLRQNTPVFKNSELTAHDIGDGVMCLEFTSKANSIGEGVLSGLQESIDLATKEGWKGVVIGNNAQNFSVGANLMMIAMMAYEQDFDQLNMAVDFFQRTTMLCRYSPIPVGIATQGYVFGGACETLMHCDTSAVAAESYIGLVEAGVGLIPGGAGTKEFAVRASDDFNKGGTQIPVLIERFKTIAMASVATSGHQAYDFGYLKKDKDHVVINKSQNIYQAKNQVLALADNYSQPIQREDVTVLGRTGLAALYVAANELLMGNYASEHDIKIAKKIAYVLCGGDLTGTQQVSEQYLLDIEREAFLSLCGEKKTLERIQHMLTTNKPLRN